MRRVLFLSALILNLFVVVVSATAQSGIDILSFESQIDISDTGDMEVTETFILRSSAEGVRFPFVRKFPTRPRSAWDHPIHLRILGVTRNGEEELPFHLQYPDGSIHVVVGERGIIVDDHPMVVALHYKMSDQVQFFDSYDELYIRAIPGFTLPVETARISISLPETIPADSVRVRAYTKRQQAKENEFLLDRLQDHRWLLTLNQRLSSHEEFNVVMGWPKGYIFERPYAEAMPRRTTSNFWQLLVFLTGCFGLFLFYASSRSLFGTWKKPRRVKPQSEIPRGLLAPEIRYVWNTTYDGVAFACLVLQLAVKGYLKVVQEHRDYGAFAMDVLSLHRCVLNRGELLHPLEQEVYERLFERSDKIELASDDMSRLKSLSQRVQEYCERNHDGYSFIQSSSLLGYGLLFNVLVMGATLVAAMIDYGGTIQYQQLYIPFGFQWIAFLLFFFFIKKRSYIDKKLIASCAGYRNYLVSGISDDERTANVYEQHCAYALALGCAEDWVKHFQDLFERDFHASWYEVRGQVHERHEPDAFLHNFPALFSSVTQV